MVEKLFSPLSTFSPTFHLSIILELLNFFGDAHSIVTFTVSCNSLSLIDGKSKVFGSPTYYFYCYGGNA